MLRPDWTATRSRREPATPILSPLHPGRLAACIPAVPFNDRQYDDQFSASQVLSTTMAASIRDVGVGHCTAFFTALANMLRTDLAEHTYAEIIDGAPTVDTWSACKRWRHYIIEQHKELCAGTLEAARQFRTDLRPENLAFNPTVRTPPVVLKLFPINL